MSDDEVRRWLGFIGVTPSQQLWRVKELLAHANGDRMSHEDRWICRRALQLLEQDRRIAV